MPIEPGRTSVRRPTAPPRRPRPEPVAPRTGEQEPDEQREPEPAGPTEETADPAQG